MPTAQKPCEFVGSSKADLSAMPEEVKETIGFAIFMAQSGEKHRSAKPLKGFGGAGVLEVVEDFDGDTYRAVYTVRFAGVIYVLPSSVQPDAMGRSMTFFIWTALILGGAATVFGPVLGAVLFFVVRLFIRTVASDFIPDSIMNQQQAEQFSYVLVGVALMLLIVFRPQGLLGNKKELTFSV